LSAGAARAAQIQWFIIRLGAYHRSSHRSIAAIAILFELLFDDGIPGIYSCDPYDIHMCLNMEDGNGLFLTGELMAEMGPTLTTSSSWDGDGMCVPILRHHREGHTIDVPFIAQISEISAARDLRPEKVLLSDRMTPIVADLGAGIIPW
jgi:hypothetical protein